MTLGEFCLALSKSLKLCAKAPVTYVTQGSNPLSGSYRNPFCHKDFCINRQTYRQNQRHGDPGGDTEAPPRQVICPGIQGVS